MCLHPTNHRFDPGMCAGACPACGQYVGSEPGQPTTAHQAPGERDMCPGSGQPAA